MKIWVIGRGVPTTKNRMLGQFELGQAQLLAKRHKVTYLAQPFTFHPKYRTPGYFFRRSRVQGVDVFSTTAPYLPGRLNVHLGGYYRWRWRRFLRRVEARTGTPDVIHVHYPAMIGEPDVLRVYKERGVKIVCTEHWSRVLTKQPDAYQLARLRKFAALADGFACVGQPLKQAVEELCGGKTAVTVVPNVVSGIFTAAPEKKTETFTFVAVGRLVPGKQFDRVVQAFAQAFAGDDRMRLTLIGDGPEREPLQRLAQQLGVEAQVTLTGTLAREDVAARMMQAHCLVCYSALETFGVPVIEGWASGLPVIASDALGFSQDWDDARGLVVSHRDVTALEKAMRDVFAGYDRYDPQALSAYAKEMYGEAAFYARLMKLYGC